MTLKFRLVPRDLDGEIVLYAVVNITTYEDAPEKVTLDVVSETHGHAKFTTTMGVYRSLTIGHFGLYDESEAFVMERAAN